MPVLIVPWFICMVVLSFALTHQLKEGEQKINFFFKGLFVGLLWASGVWFFAITHISF